MSRIEDGIPSNSLREMKALQHLDHPNVVSLFDAFADGSKLALVFEYMASDLSEVISSATELLPEEAVKGYMQMLLRGLAHCHARWIVHRDIKPANLLIAPDGTLKLADFGLARVMNPKSDRPYTHTVATRWYRAPELLYGAKHYGAAVDLWSAGCVFAELLNHSPLFVAESDIEQLYRVQEILGTPDSTLWPGLETLPDYHKISFPRMPGVPLEHILCNASPLAMSLLRRFLVYSPAERISAEEALAHPWFTTAPLPLAPSELPVPRRRRSQEPECSFDVDLPFMFPVPLPTSPEPSNALPLPSPPTRPTAEAPGPKATRLTADAVGPKATPPCSETAPPSPPTRLTIPHTTGYE